MNVKLKYHVSAPYDIGIVKARGIEDVEGFLHPRKENLQEPWFLDNMMQAVTIVSIFHDKSTLVVVDSDADGYNSASMLINYLQECYPSWEIDYFLHDKKQHGLQDVVSTLENKPYELVILPDAGSNDDEYFEMFPEISFVVLDHHLREGDKPIPSNTIIVNNQNSEKYINKSLCGAGVTWQFCRAYDEIFHHDYAWKYIDQAAVAIIGDVMDITTPENAYIIKEGLANPRNSFIKLLCNNAAYSLGAELTPIGIAFYIIPMINAMCRTGKMEEKDRMFKAFTWPETMVMSHKRGVAPGTEVKVGIESIRECTNTKARQKREQQKMADLCEKKIIEEDLLNNKIIIIVLDETFDDIPSELNGLAATQLSNKYNHPVYILRENEDGELKGSGRGLTTIDMPPLKDFMESSGLTEFVQGHQNAHGACIKAKNLEKFIAWANDQLKDVDMNSKSWQVDFNLKADDPNIKDIIFATDKLSPYYGQGFPEVEIAVHDIDVPKSDIRVMGKTGDTVKVVCNGIAYMFFKRNIEEVKKMIEHPRMCFNIVGKPNVNYYNGAITPQIFVDDYECYNATYRF